MKRSTVPVNPFIDPIVIVEVLVVKVSIEIAVGLALMEKSGATTVTETKSV